MNLIDFFNVHYRPRRLLGKSANTTRLYLTSIRNFRTTIETEPTLSDLSDENVIRHMQRMVDDGKSAATANKDRAQLLTLWRHAHRNQMVTAWPSVPELIEPQRTPQAWLPDELGRLLDAIDKEDGYFETVPRSLWWRTLVEVCLDTGERIHAVRSMKWEWIAGDWVNFPAEVRKGGRRDRAYKLSPKTLGHLLSVQFVSPATPFPWPYSSAYIWTLFGKLLKAAGLPDGRRNKFHMLRRTTASVVHSSGGDAQEALDHQHRRTTQRYLDPRFTRDRQACDVLADFLANPPSAKERRSGQDRRTG